jgi:SAM-dependent MidA family methyltransferase
MQGPASRGTLPPPSPEAAAHSARVQDHIRGLIARAGGWIGFDRYMEAALYAPGLGYYAAGAAKFGPAGDFVTAPELHPVFAQVLAGPVADVLGQSAPHVLECGAGTGRLAADLLAALDEAGALPATYSILELSGELRARQQATLARTVPRLLDRVRWLDALPQQFEGCIVGNEVLDAMPVRLFHWEAGRVQERGVAVAPDGAFAWEGRPADAELEAFARAVVPAGVDRYVSEAPFAMMGFVRSLAGLLRHGAALFIDYGFPAAEYYHPQRDQGTLMCHYRHHALIDPFFLPGLADITAHVDFTRVAQVAEEEGLECLGYASQGRFLIDAGLMHAVAREEPGTPAYFLLAGAVQKLVSEAEMGELFKVMALGRRIHVVPQGLTARRMLV